MKRIRFIIGCNGPMSDRGGDTFVLGLIAMGIVGALIYSISAHATGEASAFTAVLMAVINTIKEGRSARSAERTIQQVTPGATP